MLSAHIKTNTLRKGDISKWKTWNNVSIVPWQSWLDHVGTRKLPCPIWRRSWWWTRDVYSRMRKKVVFSPSPLFLWLQNCSPLSSQGLAPSRPPACKPHKRPILINHCLSITLTLAEFFLHWDMKDRAPWSPPETTLIGFGSTHYVRYIWSLLFMAVKSYNVLWTLN